MSDSLPPNGGPDPFDGPDLEGLLSGENVRLPDGMRPVARTLAALRTAPTRAELSGEAAARAAFREIMVPAWSESAPPPVAAHTLILPTRAADPEPRPGLRPGPRRRPAHRRPPRRGRWRSRPMVAAAGAAAAVVLVGGIALAGVFSGGSGTPGLAGHSSSASGTASRTSPAGSNGVMGTASKEPTASPSPSHPAGQQSSNGGAGPSELCRQYLDLIARGSHADRATERYDLRQLSGLAGGAWHVFGYCVQLQPWSMTQNQPGSDPDGVGFPADSQYSSDSQVLARAVPRGRAAASSREATGRARTVTARAREETAATRTRTVRPGTRSSSSR